MHRDVEPAGVEIKPNRFGGSATEYCNGIALDSARNVYVVGVTNSTDFPVTANAFQGNLRGSVDAFLAKLAL